jgi:hypothetical protein
MTEAQAKQLLDTIVGQVFGYQNPLSLEQAATKFAFDVRLPQQVFDSQTGAPTWAASMGQRRYLNNDTVAQRVKNDESMQAYRTLGSIDDILEAWNAVNYTASERQIGSSGVLESDGVYHSENVYRSIDIRKSKNVLLSDGIDSCEYIVGGQTSKNCHYAIRVEDSKNIRTSFNVVWSNKVTDSYFIQDCFDVRDCMFCTHLAGKQYCIANMQFEESEYRRVKDMVARWILQS